MLGDPFLDEAPGAPRDESTLDDPTVSVSAQAFADTLSFSVDSFQQRAFAALDAGASVVVAAPTGSGKTLVAEYAVFLALQSGGKAFYTAPVKALSNQKFADLVARYGADNIGLLTGDNSLNPDAPVVVMTTEVLRNMIYARSRTLDNLRFVILDEVHYLQDAYRGPVWEEVIIHSPPTVDLVCLSATVSNAEELADWVSSVRGHTEVIIHEERPTELNHLYLIGNRDSGEVTILPTFVDGRPNPQAAKLDAEGAGNGGGFGKPRTNNRRTTATTPRRFEIIEALRIEDMLPAIYFIFSRAACNEAAMACLHAGLRLTAPDERRHIRAIVEERVVGLSDDDLRVLDYGRFLAGLENGYAAHHAGMVPPFKEAVEACFVEGLLKVVFATETLALGINMPARTVVIEKLSKFGGERHSFLTPGEFTQLTGRAGRRGIDPVGYAATLWTPFVPFDQVASLASRRTYELKSAFRPTNNMTVNLVRRYSPTEAHHLLSLSFAQYRIDGDLVSLHVRIDRLRRELGDARERALCERGDVSAHIAKQKRQLSPAAPEREIAALLDGLRPGDILAPNAMVGASHAGGLSDRDEENESVPERGARPGDDWLLVIATARRRGRDTTVRALRSNGRMLALTPRDFHSLPNVVTNVKLPVPFNPNSRSFLEAAAVSLNKATQRAVGPKPGKRNRNASNESFDDGFDTGSSGSRHKVDRDGVEGCPDFKLHLKSLERVRGLNSEINLLQSRITDRKESLSAQFDRVLQLLEGLGYLDGWSITPFGDMLAGIFHESDLLIAECLRSGVLDGLTPPQLAGLISVFVYETRGPGSGAGRRGRSEAAVERSRRTIAAGRNGRPPASVGTGRPGTRGDHDARRHGDLPLEFPKALAARYWSMNEIAQELNDDEAALDLPLSKTLDPGFVAVAQRWAGGRELDAVLAEGEITGGDFVRTIKILIDLLRQIGKVSSNLDTAKTASHAADALFRGVVKASSLDQLSDVVGSVDLSPPDLSLPSPSVPKGSSLILSSPDRSLLDGPNPDSDSGSDSEAGPTAESPSSQ